MAEYKFNELEIGQFYEEEKTVSEEDGKTFAEISNDFNPIHLDSKYAESTRFGKRIVHGMLVGSFISGIIGNRFPGAGSVYMGQELFFKGPVYYNTKIIIRVEVTDLDKEKNRVYLRTLCKDETGRILIDGKAKVLFEN